jgi:glutamate--cysteine ligase
MKARAVPNHDRPIARYDDLLAPFHQALSPAHRIGIEMEKPGVYADGTPISYEGDRGILAIFDYLQSTHGWSPESETPGGPIIALRRGQASVTLEPGAQLELSGAPLEDIHQVARELESHMTELRPISRKLGITWLGIGFHPFARREELPWVPKARYAIMKNYLPTRGAYALDMMQRTSTVQANFDYSTEERAMRKLVMGLKLAPLTTALFANSPIVECKPIGGPSMRARVWLEVDPDRTGLVPKVWHKNATFRDYVEWALDVPMFLFKRDGEIKANTGQTFREFWKDGCEGERATEGDWQLHLNTLFPDVRLKRTIEIRGADSQSLALAPALGALYTGIFYDDKAMGEVQALVEPWGYEDVLQARGRIWKEGLHATLAGRPLFEHAERLLEASRSGLQRRKKTNSQGQDESIHLDALSALVAARTSPASTFAGLSSDPESFKKAVIERAAL